MKVGLFVCFFPQWCQQWHHFIPSMPTTSELDIVGERILKWFPFLFTGPCYLTIDLSACNMKGPETSTTEDHIPL